MSRPQVLDPLELSVMSHAFAMIAEEMGTILVRGSLSPNIRERKDASSALFDASGRMIAQAAHIPVHLGALADAVAVAATHAIAAVHVQREELEHREVGAADVVRARVFDCLRGVTAQDDIEVVVALDARDASAHPDDLEVERQVAATVTVGVLYPPRQTAACRLRA